MSDDLIICDACKEPADSACDECSCPYAVPKPKLVEVTNDGRPSLNDIPARLRLLADNIERGEFPECETAIVVINKDGWPDVLQYGNIENTNHPMIQLQLALHWLTERITKRRG